MLAALLIVMAVGIAAVVALGIVLLVVGAAFGMAAAALALFFKALPLLLVGWLVWKFVLGGGRPRTALPPADQRWLDS